MANGERQGQTDGQQGKPMAPQGNKSHQEYQNYQQGWNNGSKK